MYLYVSVCPHVLYFLLRPRVWWGSRGGLEYLQPILKCHLTTFLATDLKTKGQLSEDTEFELSLNINHVQGILRVLWR